MDYPFQAQSRQSAQYPFQDPRNLAQPSIPTNHGLPSPDSSLRQSHSGSHNVTQSPQQAFGVPKQHRSVLASAPHPQSRPAQYPLQESGIPQQPSSQQFPLLQPPITLPDDIHQQLVNIWLENAAFICQLPLHEQYGELLRQNKSLKNTLTSQQVKDATTQFGYSSASRVGEHSLGVAVGKTNHQSGFSLTAPTPEQPPPDFQQPPVNQQFPRKEKRICCNCKQRGHRLARCFKADSDGFMSGCPICGKMDHGIDECTSEKKLSDYRWFFQIQLRNGRPLFRSNVDIRDISGFFSCYSRPWTPNFAKRNANYYKTHAHLDDAENESITPDPAWESPEEIPRGSLAYQYYERSRDGSSGQSSTTVGPSHVAQTSNPYQTITPTKYPMNMQPVDDEASVLEDDAFERSTTRKRGREDKSREDEREHKRSRSDSSTPSA